MKRNERSRSREVECYRGENKEDTTEFISDKEAINFFFFSNGDEIVRFPESETAGSASMSECLIYQESLQ